MKSFVAPHMERINLIRQDITAASLCNSKYCHGYTCPTCENKPGCDDFACLSQQPCTSFECGVKLCQEYDGQ